MPPVLMKTLGRAAVYVLFAAAYGLGAYLSLQVERAPSGVALIWIPTGIALGCVFLLGPWLLLALFSSVLALNLLLNSGLFISLGFAMANTVGVAVAASALRYPARFHPGFKRARDVITFVCAAILGSGIGGLVAGITIAGLDRNFSFLPATLHWALAESLSMIAMAPFYLATFSGSMFQRRWSIERKLECTALTLLTCMFGYMVFLEKQEYLGFFSRSSILMPVLLWAALRFNPRIICAYIQLLTVAAISGALLGRGNFSFGDLASNLVEVQVYVGIICVCALLITAVSYERARLAREREAELRRIANAIPELVWTANAAGETTFLNDQAYKYFGLGPEVDIRAAWKLFVHPDDLEASSRHWQASITAQTPFEVEHRLRASDGRYEWFLTKARTLQEDQEGRYQWFGASMSVEQQRRTITALEEEKDIRDRMVFTLSHDIRNPLAVIDAGAQVLLKAPPPEELARTFLEQIAKNVQRANRMIVDLLDANRLRAGNSITPKMGPTELVGVLKEAVGGLKTIHGDVFKFDAPAEVHGYWAGEEIRRITENLCANAVKYGDPSRGVEISLRVAGEGGEVSLCVHNYGSVIREHDRDRIFQLFHRNKDSLEGDRKGWGIGLTLVHGLTAAHGGRVEVSSSPEAGTAFTVRLPRDSRAFAKA